MTRAPFAPEAEFDRQLRTLTDLCYPKLAGLSDAAFAALLAPLRRVAAARGGEPPAEGRMPFLLVVTRELVRIEDAMPLTTLHGKTRPGFVDRSYEPGALERFVTAEGVELPDKQAYLLFDVERGEEYCGAIPNDAMAAIAARGRTLLTIEEGIAFITHQPEALAKNKCFSLGASRSGDKRVPAVWRSDNKPKLGWCWAGNPHTWLGMASAGERASG
jgi:hypothetical protein